MKYSREISGRDIGQPERHNFQVPQDKTSDNVFIWRKKFGLLNSDELTADKNIVKLHKQQIKKNREELEAQRKRRRVYTNRACPWLSDERKTDVDAFEQKYAEVWMETEESFFLNQVKERTKIRLTCGRPQAIDLLANFVNEFTNKPATDYMRNNPLIVIDKLNYPKLLDLHEDITVYRKVNNEHEEFWKCTSIIVKKKIELHGQSASRLGVSETVKSDVEAILRGKNAEQLAKLESQIKYKMSNSKNIDISYWEYVSKELLYRVARLTLSTIIDKKRQSLILSSPKRAQGQQIKDEQGCILSHHLLDSNVENTELKSSNNVSTLPHKHITDNQLSEIDAIQAYKVGNYSPQLVEDSEMETGATVQDANVDWEKLLKSRRKIERSSVCPHDVVNENFEKNYDSNNPISCEESTRQCRPMDTVSTRSHPHLPTGAASNIADYKLGEDFSIGECCNSNFHHSSDSYIGSNYSKWNPRKPKFHNRVVSGFCWTRYNRTHYDRQNPPPKTVMGYKFTIFYPDLMDKSKLPGYSISACDSDEDRGLAVIKFTASPPYEDIAFKIVNKEWEYSKRRGFRCEFERGTCYLWFNFKRFSYRR